MDQKDVLFKEIDLIQGCISRMARNSFEIKKWTVGLITIILGVLGSNKFAALLDSPMKISLLFLMIICTFWYLDAYFLRLERLYRLKYNWVIKNHYFYHTVLHTVSYEYAFDLNPYNESMILDKKEFRKGILSTMISYTLLCFYGCLALFCFIIFYGSTVYYLILSFCSHNG